MADWIGSMRPALDARIEGSELFTAPANSISTHYITFSFDCMFNGLEFYAWDSSAGDNLSMSTEYNAGPYGWKRYKKFAKNFNVYPNNVTRVILFPTEPKLGVRMALSYDNKGVDPVKFSINKFQFSDIEKVNPSELGEGEDW